MLVKYSKRFAKSYDKAPTKVRGLFERRVEIFVEDKYHPLLNNHALGGKFMGYRSINITGDWRAVFMELLGGVAYFVDLGTHSQLYG